MEEILSKNNDKVKSVSELFKSSKARGEQGLFALEGLRLCIDAAKSGVEIVDVFVTEALFGNEQQTLRPVLDSAERVYMINDSASAKMSDTKNPQGIYCICRINLSCAKTDSFENILNYSCKYIALENIQDPANIGAISRTAEALGISGLIISGGCDIYNPKAQRAAMGALLRLNIIVTENLTELLETASHNGMNTVAAVPDNDAENLSEFDFGKGTICVIGNEANGISENVMRACSKKLTIKMRGRAESLNAAAAAAIIIWRMSESI